MPTEDVNVHKTQTSDVKPITSLYSDSHDDKIGCPINTLPQKITCIWTVISTGAVVALILNDETRRVRKRAAWTLGRVRTALRAVRAFRALNESRHVGTAGAIVACSIKNAYSHASFCGLPAELPQNRVDISRAIESTFFCVSTTESYAAEHVYYMHIYATKLKWHAKWI